MKIIQFIARQKYRFDQGMSLAQIIQLALLVVAASPVLQTVIHVPVKTLVAIIVPAAYLIVWVCGWLMDKVNFLKAYTEEQNKNNPTLLAVHKSVKEKI